MAVEKKVIKMKTERPKIDIVVPKGFIKIDDDLIRLDSIVAVWKEPSGFTRVYLLGGEIMKYSRSVADISHIIQAAMENN